MEEKKNKEQKNLKKRAKEKVQREKYERKNTKKIKKKFQKVFQKNLSQPCGRVERETWRKIKITIKKYKKTTHLSTTPTIDTQCLDGSHK